MTTSRRGFLRIAGLGGLAAGLPACSSVLPAPDTRTPGFGTSATGVVQVWCRAATLVERFNASQSRLTVELTPVRPVPLSLGASAVRAGRRVDRCRSRRSSRRSTCR